MRVLKSRIGWIAGVFGAALLLTGSSCSGPPTAADRDAATKMGAYERLQRNQPALEMEYSPARNTINKWTEQWGVPGKLSYVYLLSAGTGAPIGYYVFEGLPVSYCTTQTPPYQLEGSSSGSLVSVPSPGVDGTYGSSFGCNQFFGVEAQTGAILEFGGDGIAYLLSESPLQLQAPPLATATVEGTS